MLGLGQGFRIFSVCKRFEPDFLVCRTHHETALFEAAQSLVEQRYGFLELIVILGIANESFCVALLDQQ